MKTLTSIAIVAALSISASAYAGSDFWIKNGSLLDRHSNPNDVSFVAGATQGDSTFWTSNSDLLVRHSNPNDISFQAAASDRIASQPEIGAASFDTELPSSKNFFELYGDLLERNTNPHK